MVGQFPGMPEGDLDQLDRRHVVARIRHRCRHLPAARAQLQHSLRAAPRQPRDRSNVGAMFIPYFAQ